jgi:Ca2+:H+ antiporter
VLAATYAVIERAGVIETHGAILATLAAALMLSAVFAAVHHADVLAARIGEPLGSLVLAASVTIIEVTLIVTVMLGGPEGGDTVARDTVFAAVMIVLTGIIGLCLLAGGMRHGEQGFQVRGATGALSVLATLTTLALILPNFTVAEPGPYYSTAQLVGVGLVSIVLYGLFLFVQSVRHPDDFVDLPGGAAAAEERTPPSAGALAVSVVFLLLSLAAVVIIAEGLSPLVETAVGAAGLPAAFVGVVIASVVLLPEGLAAYRAARSNRLQRSLNLALGSALASIGLTIPAVAAVSVVIGAPLGLGLEAEHVTLLVLALFVSVLTLATGRTTVLQGGVHLVVFAAFLIIAAFP